LYRTWKQIFVIADGPKQTLEDHIRSPGLSCFGVKIELCVHKIERTARPELEIGLNEI
jgi:hypothetical protein